MENGVNIISQFDELIRCYNILLDSSCETEFIRFVTGQEINYSKYVDVTNECKRLKEKLDLAVKDVSVLDGKLSSVRRWLDGEKRQRKMIENERDAYANQLDEVRRILMNDPRCLSDETKQQLAFLNGDLDKRMKEYGWESTSCSSDFSITRSGDDLDLTSDHKSDRKTRRSSLLVDQMNVKKPCRTSVLLNQSVTLGKRKSTEPLDYPPPTVPSILTNAECFESNEVVDGKNTKRENTMTPVMRNMFTQNHNFMRQTFVLPQTCVCCIKKMKFGQVVMKCVDCGVIAHNECHTKVPLPCIPLTGTPTKKTGSITDYAPTKPPKIPAIVIHCVHEIEQRGLNEVGLYRISCAEGAARQLKEKFLKSKGVQNLSQIDIHVIACCLKEFLRSLQDKLVPHAKWTTFADAIRPPNEKTKLENAVAELPEVNRNTLAFLMLHLHNVAASGECKMNVSNLARVFGPTIVGYSTDDQTNALAETATANSVVEELLSLPKEIWNRFLQDSMNRNETPFTIRNTPSVESLTKSRKFLLTPGGKKRFFNALD